MLFRQTVPVKDWLSSRLGRLEGSNFSRLSQDLIQDEEVEDIKETKFLNSHLEKIISPAPNSSLEYELRMAHARRLCHAPVMRYTMRDAIVRNSGAGTKIYSNRKNKILSGSLLLNAESIPEATNCMTSVAQTFFGHWLQDACSTALLAASPSRLVLDRREDWPHTWEYSRAFDLDPVPVNVLHVGSLHTFQDFGQGSSKRARYQVLRNRALAHFGRSYNGPELVYFRRGSLGVSRQIRNEGALTETLVKSGFTIFDLQGATARQIHRIFQNAKLVVSVDGSHLNHLYYSLPPQAALITLVAADSFTMTQVGYAAALNLHYGFMVLDGAGGSYEIDTDDLFRTIDLVWR